MTIVTNLILSAYCSCSLCCGKHATGLDATGHKPKQGITVAIPRRFPLGSKVLIGNHFYTGTDRLARRFDNRIDIYFQSHKDAVRFGIQKQRVKIITTTK